MIISHKHRFIYIKTRKTASTSLEIALRKFCGPEDVITRFTDADELVCRELGYPGPQNEEIGNPYHRQHDRWINHSPASIAKAVLGEKVWNEYFKFTIERNPFDKAISRYFWAIGRIKNPPGLSEFLRDAPHWRLSSWDLYTIGDAVAVDLVGKYEDMATHLDVIAGRIGLPEAIVMPQHRAKGGYRTDRRSYREILSAADRSVIERVCHREIAYFGYAW